MRGSRGPSTRVQHRGTASGYSTGVQYRFTVPGYSTRVQHMYGFQQQGLRGGREARTLPRAGQPKVGTLVLAVAAHAVQPLTSWRRSGAATASSAAASSRSREALTSASGSCSASSADTHSGRSSSSRAAASQPALCSGLVASLICPRGVSAQGCVGRGKGGGVFGPRGQNWRLFSICGLKAEALA